MEKWKKFRDSIYSVSNEGRVRNDVKGTILKPYPNQYGRLLVDARSTLGKCFQVHQNNELNNLEYVTAKENMIHAFQNGLRYKKEIPKFRKMRDDIFQLSKEGYSQSKIAKTLGINQSHVSRTLRGEAYTTLNQQGVTL